MFPTINRWFLLHTENYTPTSGLPRWLGAKLRRPDGIDQKSRKNWSKFQSILKLKFEWDNLPLQSAIAFKNN